MYFADMLPGRWKDVISKQSDLVNAPRIGVENNLMFGNVQMNIASAKRKEGSLLFVLSVLSSVNYIIC